MLSPLLAQASAQDFKILIATTEWSLGCSLTRSRTSPSTVARTCLVVGDVKPNHEEAVTGGDLRIEDEEEAIEDPLAVEEAEIGGGRLVSVEKGAAGAELLLAS